MRCKDCNRSHSALQRLYTKEPATRAKLYEKFSKDSESRKAFICRSRGLVGEDLKCLVDTIITEKTTRRNGSTRIKHTDILDSPELKKRLVDKPDQLKRILDSGHEFEHPDTGARMYYLTTFTQDNNYCKPIRTDALGTTTFFVKSSIKTHDFATTNVIVKPSILIDDLRTTHCKYAERGITRHPSLVYAALWDSGRPQRK